MALPVNVLLFNRSMQRDVGGWMGGIYMAHVGQCDD